MKERITIDFETRSLVDLLKTTVDRYAADPSTEILCMSVKMPKQATVWWVPEAVLEILGDLKIEIKGALVSDEWITETLLASKYVIEAHNSGFEDALWHHIMHKRLGFPDVPLRRWRCSAAKAATHALPRALGNAAQALHLPVQKDTAGSALMKKMCKPLPPLKKHYEDAANELGIPFADFKAAHSSADMRKRDYMGEHDRLLLRWLETPEAFVQLINYCITDADAEHGLSSRLTDLPEYEQEFWFLDQIINQRGIPVDLEACKAVIEFTDQEKARLTAEFQNVTGGAVASPSYYKAFAEWVSKQGVACTSVSADHIAEILERTDVPEIVEAALRIAQKANKSSVAKYQALIRGASKDGRMRGTMLYHGANTGRHSGKIFQPHNLPRGTFSDTEDCIDLLTQREFEAVRMLWGDPMPTASTCIRGMICATEGKRLVAADYSAIEGRVFAWLADDQAELDIYREGKCSYCAVAADCFNVPYEEIYAGHKAGNYEMTKLRADGKTGALACQFGGGQGAVAKFAPDMLRADRVDLVKRWRTVHPKARKFWYDLTDAAADAVTHPGEVFTVGKLAYLYRKEYGFLMCRLPSGRKIYYPEPTCHTEWIGPGEAAKKALITPGVKFTFSDMMIWADNSGGIHVKQPDVKEKVFPKEGIGFTPLWRKEARRVQAWCVDSKTNKWVKRDLSHLILSENATQAVARDLLVAGLLNVDEAGYSIIFHVHDEIVAEDDEDFGSVDEFEKLMCQAPEWAKGLPLAAEGWSGKRFKK